MKKYLPVACMAMKDWKPEGWERPEAFGEFPLRDICPDAANFFVSAGNYSNRDMMNISSYLKLGEYDPRNAAATYDKVLERIEKYPAALPFLESVIHHLRNGITPPHCSQNAVKILKNFPISKLRLNSNVDLQIKIKQICLPTVGVDLAVSVFCEYCIEAYYHEKGSLTAEEFGQKLNSVLLLGKDEKNIERKMFDISVKKSNRSQHWNYFPKPEANQTQPAHIEGGASVARIGTSYPTHNIFVDLISRDIIGIGAIIAEAYEGEHLSCPIEAAALLAAAGTRTPHRKYGQDTQNFINIVNEAISDELSELGSILLAGALIRPSIMNPSFPFRHSLARLCSGNLGNHLNNIAEEIGNLEYDFPPDEDELADLSKVRKISQKQLAIEKLGNWCDENQNKTSPWRFATAFMRYVTSEQGLIGLARMKIEQNSEDSTDFAESAISNLESGANIESCAKEYARQINHPNSQLYPRGIKYLKNHFDEPLGFLNSWIRAVERERTKERGHRSITKFRTTIRSLDKNLNEGANALLEHVNSETNSLECAVARWVVGQIEITIEALKGSESNKLFPTLNDAINAERDLLPATLRSAIKSKDERFNSIQEFAINGIIPDPEQAIEQACKEASFETAIRVSDCYRIMANKRIREELNKFIQYWEPKIESRLRKLKLLAKFDFAHLDEIDRHLRWCEITIERFSAAQEIEEIHDFTEINDNVCTIDKLCTQIEKGIRASQEEQINFFLTDQNAEEARNIIGLLESQSIESTENQIAQLRDGRSTENLHAETKDMNHDFTQSFLIFASSSNWPQNMDDYRRAVSEDGKLYVDEDRRSAAIKLIKLYRDFSSAPDLSSINMLQNLFEEIGFTDVRCQNFKKLRDGMWQVVMNGKINSVDWFIPPIFGSDPKAKSGYLVFVIEEHILAENVLKELNEEKPAILLLSGVADNVKRREFAERLREGNYPALLIDEALIAFAATHRVTRARTFFECGLPYGRIEPYITDASAIPPEMFFGRSEEIKIILSRSDDGCLVYGGRQLGKSALLNHVARTNHSPDQSRIFLREPITLLGKSEKSSEIWTHLRNILKPYGVVLESSRSADSVIRDITNWDSSHPDGRIICMFDEADNFMDAESKANYAELIKLKQLMVDTEKNFKVVFAGLHNVQRINCQPNSPLAHFGKPICIGPLSRTIEDKRAAFNLLVQPMSSAGFRFEGIEPVDEILSWANYYPSLVQVYAKRLLSSLHASRNENGYKLPDGEPLWEIPSMILFQHEGFDDCESSVRDKFRLTLDLDPRYALIAYTLARLNAEGNVHKSLISGFDSADLLEEAMPFWPTAFDEPTQAGFEALLDELYELGVLGRIQVPKSNHHTYLLRTRRVASMLGSGKDIDRELQRIEEIKYEVTYDRTTHRRHYYSSHNQNSSELYYSPLTDLQIENLFNRDGPSVQIICGLDVLGISNVGRSLINIFKSSHIPGMPEGSVKVRTTIDAKRIGNWTEGRGMRNERFLLAIYTPSNANDAENVISKIETRPLVLNGDVRPVIVLDAADDIMREIACRRINQTQFLTPWNDNMIRMHLQLIECTDLDKREIRERILMCTGGIPSEIQKLVNKISQDKDLIDFDKNWNIQSMISENILLGNLGKALNVIDLANCAGGDDDDYQINELMREQVGHDWITIGPDILAAGLLSRWDGRHSSRNRLSSLGELILKLRNTINSAQNDTD